MIGNSTALWFKSVSDIYYNKAGAEAPEVFSKRRGNAAVAKIVTRLYQNVIEAQQASQDLQQRGIKNKVVASESHPEQCRLEIVMRPLIQKWAEDEKSLLDENEEELFNYAQVFDDQVHINSSFLDNKAAACNGIDMVEAWLLAGLKE